MLKRTLTGVGITTIVYLVIIYSHLPAVIAIATALLSAFAVFEIYVASGLSEKKPLLIVSVAAAMAFSVASIQNYTQILGIVFPTAVLLFVWMMCHQNRCRFDKPIKAVLVALLAVLLYKAIPELRRSAFGLEYLLISVSLCFVTDVAAYLVGSHFGKHKLIPKVSPNKTIEGSIAGIATSVVFLLVFGWLMENNETVQVDYLLLIVYAAGASIVAQFGDLSMSVVKRICGVKDFGNLLPGHGGILDRFDSHMLCIAFTLLFCTFTGGFLR